MASQYLLDTNTASCIIKGNIPAVRRRLLRVPMAQVAVSTVTEGELRYGVARRPGATKLQQIVDEFLLRVTILPWDSDAAQKYGHLRADLERLGQPMGNLDLMIGAHALAAGAILVTHDRVFARIKKLKVEDWTS
jgi:tRNA(fMet)-specific endonuclease VapC